MKSMKTKSIGSIDEVIQKSYGKMKYIVPVLITLGIAGLASAEKFKVVDLNGLKKNPSYQYLEDMKINGTYYIKPDGSKAYFISSDQKVTEIKPADFANDSLGLSVVNDVLNGTIEKEYAPLMDVNFKTGKVKLLNSTSKSDSKSWENPYMSRVTLGVNWGINDSQNVVDDKNVPVGPTSLLNEKVTHQNSDLLSGDVSLLIDTTTPVKLFKIIQPGFFFDGKVKYMNGKFVDDASIDGVAQTYIPGQKANLTAMDLKAGASLFVNPSLFPINGLGDYMMRALVLYGKNMQWNAEGWPDGKKEIQNIDSLTLGAELVGMKGRDGKVYFYWTTGSGSKDYFVNGKIDSSLRQGKTINTFNTGIVFPAIELFDKNVGIQFGYDYNNSTIKTVGGQDVQNITHTPSVLIRIPAGFEFGCYVPVREDSKSPVVDTKVKVQWSAPFGN